MVTLIANEWFKFVEVYADDKPAEIPFFVVNKKAILSTRLPWEIKDRLLQKQAYNAFEVDDLLLGHLQDLAMLWERGTLKLGN